MKAATMQGSGVEVEVAPSAVNVLVPEATAAPPVVSETIAVPQARPMAGEKFVARILRGGAALSGALFLGSVVMELLPHGHAADVAIDALRKGGLSLLLITPVARLVASGLLLGIRGEPKYTLYAGGVLVLLGIAVGAGFAA